MNSIIQHILKRKMVSGAIALVLIGGGYFGYTKIFNNNGIVRYATAQVQKGTLIVSLSGSGQVSVSNQVDIKPKASGDIVYVGVKNGQEVKAGTLIAQLDARDAQKAVRDAEVNLDSSYLALDKLKLQQQQQLRGDTLNKTYEDGMGTLADFYGEFGTILNTIDDIFFGNDLSDDYNNITYYANYFPSYSQKNSPVPRSVEKLFSEVEKLHQQAITDFQATERGGDDTARSLAISRGYELAVKTAQLIKSGRDAVRPLQNYFGSSDSLTFTKQDILDDHTNKLTTYGSTVDAYLQSLLAAVNTTNSQRDTIGNQPLDLRSQELTIKQRENALLDAKEKLADYFVRAPFDGVIAKVDAKKGDPVSSAAVIAMLITRQKLAEISLNEVDVAQVKIGQKATLTFDAIPDLTITGQVAEVDAVGTVSQGVVTYTVKIAFDTQDDRVKTAMSVSAAIVTEAKPNVLLVPNSAVKSQGGMSYVEIVDGDDKNLALAANVSGAILKNSPRRQQIEIGTASDEFTEITGGLNEGDVIVTRTIQSTATQPTQTQQQGSLRIPGLPGSGGSGSRGGNIMTH